MAIDRDDADAPDSAPARRNGIEGGDAPQRAGAPQDSAGHVPDAREQQIGGHVRYREVVEASYRAAEGRDAWTKAAPVLRAEWDAHKQRYPSAEQQPGRTLADGSWTGDGNRHLSPEQNAEPTKCAADLRDEAIGRIGPAMERVAAADPHRRLAGQEQMLKGQDRLKEKIAAALVTPPRADAIEDFRQKPEKNIG